MEYNTNEDRILYRKAVAKEICNSWSETKKCMKPLVRVLEACFDRKNVIVEGLNLLYAEFCLQQDEQEFTESIDEQNISFRYNSFI